MRTFEISCDIIDAVKERLEAATEYIRIAVFQLHNQVVFDVLERKARDGVRVEIFTLPYDAINKDIRNAVTSRFEALSASGATLHFCRWNIGDPERTSTAVGRWYSFHGKFLVTESSAIALSANLLDSRELDALMAFDNEMDKVNEFNAKFDHLLDLFVLDRSGWDGKIREHIIATNVPDANSLFELPEGIETKTHRNHWILHYPSALCQEDVAIQDKLYIAPFDCRARDLLSGMVEQASSFVFIATESFTDLDFYKILVNARLRGLDVRILGDLSSMDFPDRVEREVRKLLAANVGFRTSRDGIHAKVLLTDEHVAVSSVNLNKINLGFSPKSKDYWRANTESIVVCSDSSVIEQARESFLTVYDSATDVTWKLANKVEKSVTHLFISKFNLKSKIEAKSLFARWIISLKVEVEKNVYKMAVWTAKLAAIRGKKMVGKEEFLAAFVLYYISERKHDYNELTERLKELSAERDLKAILVSLIDDRLVCKDGDYYKINVEDYLGMKVP